MTELIVAFRNFCKARKKKEETFGLLFRVVTPSSHVDGGIRCLWDHGSTIRYGLDIRMSTQCQNWHHKLNLRSETQNRMGTARAINYTLYGILWAIKRLYPVRNFVSYQTFIPCTEFCELSNVYTLYGIVWAIKRLYPIRNFVSYLKGDLKIPQLYRFTNLTTRSVASSKANPPIRCDLVLPLSVSSVLTFT